MSFWKRSPGDEVYKSWRKRTAAKLVCRMPCCRREFYPDYTNGGKFAGPVIVPKDLCSSTCRQAWLSLPVSERP